MKNIKFISLLCSMMLILAGCSTQKELMYPRLTVFNIPSLGAVNVSELGETLVKKGKIYEYDAIILQSQASARVSLLSGLIVYPIGTYKAAYRDRERVYYLSDLLFSSQGQQELGGFSIRNDNPMVLEAYLKSQYNSHHIIDPQPSFVMGKSIDINSPNFSQELVYNGRSGSTLKFIYREFADNNMRAPFTQELLYDLNDSSIIGFKKVRINVIEATNTKIKYTVLSGFPDAF
ncbi:MAG: hypothetical protein HGB23_02265 [Chlorobiaceae bacterium]|nr:hypothetical protein [Chlorobiaceae bacterium]